MSEPDNYSTETVGESLVVQFSQPALVFPDQIQSIEGVMKTPAGEFPFQSVIFDFNKVGYISSSVWGVIILQNELLRQHDRALRLCNLNDNLKEALQVMKLDQVLTVCVTRQAALADSGI